MIQRLLTYYRVFYSFNNLLFRIIEHITHIMSVYFGYKILFGFYLWVVQFSPIATHYRIERFKRFYCYGTKILPYFRVSWNWKNFTLTNRSNWNPLTFVVYLYKKCSGPSLSDRRGLNHNCQGHKDPTKVRLRSTEGLTWVGRGLCMCMCVCLITLFCSRGTFSVESGNKRSSPPLGIRGQVWEKGLPESPVLLFSYTYD